MTKEEIIVLIVENDWEEEVYNTLHAVIMNKLQNSHKDLDKAHTDLRLIRMFADANKLDVIKDILKGDKE